MFYYNFPTELPYILNISSLVNNFSGINNLNVGSSEIFFNGNHFYGLESYNEAERARVYFDSMEFLFYKWNVMFHSKNILNIIDYNSR